MSGKRQGNRLRGIAMFLVLGAFGCKARTEAAGSETLSITSGGFHYDSVTVVVKTADGAPAPNIPVQYLFFGKKFYFSNPNMLSVLDFQPGVYSTLDKIGVLGSTDEDGQMAVFNVNLDVDPGESKLNPERPNAVTISVVNGGGEGNICPSNHEKKYYLAYGSSYLGTSAATPGGRQACSRTLLHKADDPASLQIDCYLDTTSEQLRERTVAAQERDCGV